MSSFTKVREEMREHAASKRGIFKPDSDGWSWKRFITWADYTRNERRPKNFCSYWRIVFFHSVYRNWQRRLAVLGRTVGGVIGSIIGAVVYPIQRRWKRITFRQKKAFAWTLLLLISALLARQATITWGVRFWIISGLVIAGVVGLGYIAAGIVTFFDEIIRRRRLQNRTYRTRPHAREDKKPAWGWIVLTAPVLLMAIAGMAILVLGSMLLVGPFILLHKYVVEPLGRKFDKYVGFVWAMLVGSVTTGLGLVLFMRSEGAKRATFDFIARNWLPSLIWLGLIFLFAVVVGGTILGIVKMLAYHHDVVRPRREKERQEKRNDILRRAREGKLTLKEKQRRHTALVRIVEKRKSEEYELSKAKEVLSHRQQTGEVSKQEARRLLVQIEKRLQSAERNNDPASWRPSRSRRFLNGVGEFFSLLYTIIATKKWKICPLVEIPEEEQQKSLPDTAPGGGEWYY